MQPTLGQNSVLNRFSKCRFSKRIRPIVEIDKNGEFYTIHEQKTSQKNFGFVKPIDKFFKDKKINKLIYDTKKETNR